MAQYAGFQFVRFVAQPLAHPTELLVYDGVLSIYSYNSILYFNQQLVIAL